MNVNMSMRNYPPKHGIRLPVEEMRGLVVALFEKVGMPPEDAALMGEILTMNDLECVFTHGTTQTPGYIREIQEGRVNPRPEIEVVSESPGALVLDGDGGLGYFPCYRGMEQAIEKAKTCGVAALTTRNHFHFGAARNYPRQALAHDCIGMAVSSHRSYPSADSMIIAQTGNSPISVAIPAGQQPPLIMDMSCSIAPPFEEALFEQMPVTFIKSMALAAVVRMLGGVFPGIFKEEFIPPRSRWTSNQGAFLLVVAASHFMPLEEFKQEMDRFIGEARGLQPLPGLERAELAGGMEWQWAKENCRTGIPVSDTHRDALQKKADELGVEAPFGRYEASRF